MRLFYVCVFVRCILTQSIFYFCARYLVQFLRPESCVCTGGKKTLCERHPDLHAPSPTHKEHYSVPYVWGRGRVNPGGAHTVFFCPPYTRKIPGAKIAPDTARKNKKLIALRYSAQKHTHRIGAQNERIRLQDTKQ